MRWSAWRPAPVPAPVSVQLGSGGEGEVNNVKLGERAKVAGYRHQENIQHHLCKELCLTAQFANNSMNNIVIIIMIIMKINIASSL